MPTDAEIEKVRNNLGNMQAFNDYLYDHGNPLIANCYALLSEKDQSDKGLGVVVNMMCSAFWAMSAIEGAGSAGAFAANTMCGILSAWTNGAPPPDMGGTFASLISRFEAASIDLDNQLAIYKSDPASYWNTVFTYNGQTCTLGDLATVDFPTEGDPDFYTLMNPCLWALDQYIWKFVLTSGGYIIADWEPATSMPTSFNFSSWQYSFFGAHPSYWATCEYHQDSGSCGDSSCYYLTQYNLSTGAGTFGDGHIPDNACNYLFADRGPGQTYPECTRGLYPREDVFTKWGLHVKQIWSAYAPAPRDDADYLRAKSNGQPVLSNLLAEIGLDGIKARLLEAVKQDPSLRASLQHHPHETMARILGIAVPASIEFIVVPEGPRKYALVLPFSETE